MTLRNLQFLLLSAWWPVAPCSPVALSERAVLVDATSSLQKEYDYVIIGGGTSGLTVANRLTENLRGKPEVTLSKDERVIDCSPENSIRPCHRVWICVGLHLNKRH